MSHEVFVRFDLAFFWSSEEKCMKPTFIIFCIWKCLFNVSFNEKIGERERFTTLKVIGGRPEKIFYEILLLEDSGAN